MITKKFKPDYWRRRIKRLKIEAAAQESPAEIPKFDHKSYKSTRATWESVSTDQTKFLDQANLTLAGGALGLCLTFLHDLVKSPLNVSILRLGGGLLILSILFTLGSVQVSQFSIGRYIRKLDASARANFAPDTLDFMDHKFVNIAAAVTFMMNIAASLFLIAGIVLVADFGYKNLELSGGLTMENKDSGSDPQIIKRGAAPNPPVVPASNPAPAQPSSNEPKTVWK